VLIVVVLVYIAGCSAFGPPPKGISTAPFGTLAYGPEIAIYTLNNGNGIRARVMNYGGIVQSLEVPDRYGNVEDIVLGYDTLDEYVEDNPYFGCIIGRYANRIGNARFTLDGIEYTLAANNGSNSLHGGIKGFDKVVWNARPFTNDVGEPALELTYLSKDGEEGFPGNLSVKTVYTLTDDNELKIDYYATTDKPTIVNLTHHSYFNLIAAGDSTILGHKVMIPANAFTPVDETLIPTGEIMPVIGTPFDFTKPEKISTRINSENQQLRYGNGYDHNWVLRKEGKELSLAARVYEPLYGRTMEVWTTEPGMQFYTGNFLDGSNVGKNGKAYRFRYAFCMEPQHFPDSPNKPQFPSVVLRPGDEYRSTIIYRFSTK
jgi:aldose 1-epimerase